MKKKLTALALVIVMVAMLFTGLTMAYFTDTDEATNTFTVGDINIDLEEPSWDEENAENILPGVEVEKDPYVKNIGSNDAYVRVKVSLPQMGMNFFYWKTHHDNLTLVDMLKGLDTTNWTYVGEGQDVASGAWVAEFTYNKILAANEETEKLFTHFELDSRLTQDDFYFQGQAVVPNPMDVVVTAEAIQADGFNSAEDAWAGFEGATVDTLKAGDVIQPIEAGDKVVLNLNGNTVTAVEGENKALINNGEATIKNGTVEDVDYFQNNGTAIVSDVTMKAGSPADYASITRGADAETTYNDVAITSGGGGVAAADGAEVTFNSGSVYVDTASTSGRYIFYAVGEGTEITINGGEFSWDPADNQKRAYIYAEAGTTVYVNGGTFGKASTRSGYTDGILGTGTVVIKGGTFGFNPTKWVADGYVATETSGVWTVTAQ